MSRKQILRPQQGHMTVSREDKTAELVYRVAELDKIFSVLVCSRKKQNKLSYLFSHGNNL